MNKQIELLWNKAQNQEISRRAFLKMLAVGGAASMIGGWAPTTAAMTTDQPIGKFKPATYAQLPRWRGFNLHEPYSEWDLDFITEWGFDFIRLPIEYSTWTTSPGVYNEQSLKKYDQVITWARARGIHVNLCLYRAPGYCVSEPKEPLDLWADGSGGDNARQQFAAQWKMFAERYRGIPAAELSFNLVNEPPDIPGEKYARSLGHAVAAIREKDADRLIIADGLAWGGKPVPELVALKVAQSTRGYLPFQISHYRSPWFQDADTWPVPTWPMLLNQYLYGDAKAELKKPLILKTDFPESRQLSITVAQVSGSAELFIKANGKIVWQKVFKPGPGSGEWEKSVFDPQWQIYLGTYNKEYSVTIPVETREIQIEVGRGDWLTFSAIRIKPFPGVSTNEVIVNPADTNWGVLQQTYIVDHKGVLSPINGHYFCNRETLWSDYVCPWKSFSTKYGIGIFIGEWGAYSQTPHDVTLHWMKDCLDNWRQAGIGWALWDLRGSFGVLDSERSDVAYENYQNHKLDRKMLELLRQG